MLELTRRLIENPDTAGRRWRSAAVAALLTHGSRADAEALLPAFLAAPEARGDLLPVLAEHGDTAIAERLMAATIVDGTLRDGVSSAVLRTLGHLGYEPAEHVLWRHVVQEPGGYDVSVDAALGLLHLPCESLQDQIDAALELHLGANFFPEALPALAVKTGTPGWLDRLVDWGDHGASTDCNGGLILGIALHGEPGRAPFTRLLQDPNWEADSGATGSRWWAYAGARALGISLADLYRSLISPVAPAPGSQPAPDDGTARHRIAMFAALADLWLTRPWLGLRMAPTPDEPAADLGTLLFDWSTPHHDDSLTGVAGAVLDRDDPLIGALYELERRLDDRLRYEVDGAVRAAGAGVAVARGAA